MTDCDRFTRASRPSLWDDRAMSLSPRLAALVAALPLAPGMRVLEVGCGPGAAARAAVARILLAIDRSPRAIAIARAASAGEIASGRLALACVAAEDFLLPAGEARFDLAFAFRVGALDGRHPEVGTIALARIAAALLPGAPLLIDGGDPLRPVPLPIVPLPRTDSRRK
jgi:SAM-dependent methyltransferase